MSTQKFVKKLIFPFILLLPLKNILKHNSTTINFFIFIINHPENKLIDVSTFLIHNTDVSIPQRKTKIAHPKKRFRHTWK